MSFKILICLLVLFHLESSFAIDIAITLDDLPLASHYKNANLESSIVQSILFSFEKNAIPDVYGFVVGKNLVHMPAREEIMRLWKRSKFLVGNHTYHHLDLSQVSAIEYMDSIEKNESYLLDYANTIEEMKVFRYPFLSEGESNIKRYEVRSYLNKRKYRIAHVSLDFLDWSFGEAYSRCSEKKEMTSLAEIKKKYLTFAKEILVFKEKSRQLIWGERPFPYILLLHMTPFTAEVLPDLLLMLKNEKVNFVSAKMAIFNSFYDEDTTYTGNSGKDFIQQAAETRKIDLSILGTPPSPHPWLNSLCR